MSEEMIVAIVSFSIGVLFGVHFVYWSKGEKL